MVSVVDTPALVGTEWLANRLGGDDISVVDASFHLPNAHRDARAEYQDLHIPGAVFFDINTICDASSELPHMLPNEKTMSAEAGALGIDAQQQVIVYDTLGIFSAPRLWWMLRAFGHDKVSVLDGGLAKWRSEKRPLDSGAFVPRPTNFEAKLNRRAVRNVHQMIANLGTGAEQVLDARSAARFSGLEKEPRPGLRSGHMPGALNVPFSDFLSPDLLTMLAPAQLREMLLTAGVDLERPMVSSCGSGVTACTITLGLHLLGYTDGAVYDGSWSEWGGRTDTPIVSV